MYTSSVMPRKWVPVPHTVLNRKPEISVSGGWWDAKVNRRWSLFSSGELEEWSKKIAWYKRKERPRNTEWHGTFSSLP